MLVSQHFARKKQRLLEFFLQFHALLDRVSKSCLAEIERESQLAKQLLTGCESTLIENECARMATREPESFVKIVDHIAESLKKQIRPHLPTPDSEVRTISLGKGLRKKSKDKFATPLRPTASLHEESPNVGVPILLEPTSTFASLRPEASSTVQTPVRQFSSASAKENSATCEKLDKKIQEQALRLLSKTKINRSPSHMRKGSQQKKKSLVELGDFHSDFKLIARRPE